MSGLMGLGLATPPHEETQADMAETLIDLWRLPSTDADRLRRIAADSGIDRRATVIPLAEVLPLTTHRRMEAYERLAPPLAIEAARNALGAAGVDATAITDVVVVSCTGFSAPGIDTELVTALGLPRTVRRTVVGFMGCYGAIIGLRTAAAACAASPGSVALVVCAELCSLHLQPDPSQESQVAAMLFADGAAAAVVSSGRSDTRISPGGSLLLEEAHEWMSWRITDAGFALTLSKCVPVALRRHLAAFVESLDVDPATFVVHPGGPAILDAVDEALGLDGGGGMQAARKVLRQHGNMSSATVLFVLAEIRRNGSTTLPAVLLAFGPGLAIESVLLGQGSGSSGSS